MLSSEGAAAPLDCSLFKVMMRNKIKKTVQAALLISLSISAIPARADQNETRYPERVVSMNLCTDQFAMLLASERQLISVSKLASNPMLSVMSEAAKRYPVNFGGAEEIYLMNPDLVIAGTYTNQTTVELLRGLGLEVVQVPPVRTINDIASELRRLGGLLGRQQRAEELASKFEQAITKAVEAQPNRKPRAAVYYANGYTAGDGSLVNEIIKTSGLQNIANNLGLKGTSKLPLEQLILQNPQVLVRELSSPISLHWRSNCWHIQLYNEPSATAVRFWWKTNTQSADFHS